MRISAIDALQRGVLNLRANPMLVLVQVAQGVAVMILAAAGMVPLVLAIGAGAASEIWLAGQRGWHPGQAAELEGMIERLLEQWPILLAALAAGGAVWTVAFLIYCWVQAGVMGRLAAGEDQAAESPRPTVADFKVYSWPDFSADASARIWRFFWLINLLLVAGMVVLFLIILAASLMTAVLGGGASIPAAIAVGCSLLAISLVVIFFFFAWTGVAKAQMVVADGGVLETFGRSLALLGRRFGGVLLLLLLFIVASVALTIVLVPVSLALDLAMGDSIGRQIAADLALALIQTPINAALTLTLSAALVALVRGER